MASAKDETSTTNSWDDIKTPAQFSAQCLRYIDGKVRSPYSDTFLNTDGPVQDILWRYRHLVNVEKFFVVFGQMPEVLYGYPNEQKNTYGY